jgi:hypothetical protein
MTKPNKKIKEREQVYKILKLNDATNKASWWNIADDVCELFSTDKPINKEWELEARRKLSNYWAGDWKILDDFISTLLKQQKQELKEKGEKMKKEIRYEELDTGIGIDRLEYDGQENEKGYNQGIDDFLKLF